MVSRRKVFGGIAVGAAVIGIAGYLKLKPKPPEVGFTLTNDEFAAAKRLLQAHPAIDSHAHPGRTFVRGAKNLNFKLNIYRMMGTFEDTTIADMTEGGMAGAVYNGVADFQLLELTDQGLTATREFMEGEEWQSYQTQIANMKALEADGLVTIANTSDDIRAAHAAKQQTAVLAMEGADFLNGDASRLQTVYEDGVRMLTLVHYHNNTLGDIMTGESLGRGLTDFGHEVVTGMNELGMVIDLAHASEEMSFEVVEASSKPVVVSHTHINGPGVENARFISSGLAKAVTDTGGFIGAWPAGIGIDTLAGFIDRIEELVDAVGEDHVALGSDMDANYKPVLETYRKMPLVVGALSKRDYSDEQIVKFLGGNFLRVLDEVQST